MQMFGRYISREMACLWLIECALVFGVFYALAWFATVPETLLSPNSRGAINLAAALTLTTGVSAIVIGLYRLEVCLDRRSLLRSLLLAGFLAFPVLLVVSQKYDIHLTENYLLWLAKGLIAWALCISATRWAFSITMRQSVFMRRLWVVGAASHVADTSNVIEARRGGMFKVVPACEAATFLDLLPPAGDRNDDLPPNSAAVAETMAENLRANGVWGIVVAGGEAPQAAGHGRRNDIAQEPALDPELLLDLKLRGIRVFDDLGFWEQYLGRINLDRVNTRWLMFADGFASSRFDQAVKRLTDIALSLTLLLITLPLMVITALLVKFESEGPVFYRQERVGLHGRRFTLFKFRSMSVDAESGGKPRWASQKDPRVTRIGGFLRSTRIDELPQLMNVVRGEMSFIGPRPERPHFVEQLAQLIPFYQERSYVKPGITGWAQVNFPYGASVEDARQKLSYDLYYVKNRSLMLDIVILFSTVRVILFQVGAR